MRGNHFSLGVALAAALLLRGLPAMALEPQPANGARNADKESCSRLATGGTWAGEANWEDGDTYKWTINFYDGGKLDYSYRGSTYTDGSWKQTGARINFQVNNSYAVYDGVLIGDTISGTIHNVKDKNGVWSVKRSCLAIS
jgi:hypothetical protein